MRRLYFLLFILFLYKISYSQDTISNNKLFFGKGSQYFGVWSHMGFGYQDKEPAIRSFVVSPRLGYGFFINNHLTPGFSFTYFHSFLKVNEKIIITQYMLLTFYGRYYLTQKNRLFVELSYNWGKQWKDYNFRSDKISDNYNVGIAGGINLKLLSKEDVKWLKKDVAIELIYSYSQPLFSKEFLAFNGAIVRIGLVGYF